VINEPASSEIGLSGYAVLQALGKGGVGEVVLAHQVALNREVAIKRIRRGRSGDAKALARLKR
jgi:serine/threonine protein kinase